MTPSDSVPCAKFADRLLLYDAGDLDGENFDEVRAHIAECNACRAELHVIRRVQMVARATGGDTDAARFDEMLERAARARPAAFSPWRWAAVAAAAVILFAGGLVTGRATDDATGRDARRLEDLLVLTTGDDRGASERLAALARAVDSEWDDRLNATLVNALNRDPSLNVRLAVIDAMYLMSPERAPRGAVAASLVRQPSPIIRHAIIDYLVNHDVDEARALLGIVAARDSVLAVREHAAWARDRIAPLRKAM